MNLLKRFFETRKPQKVDKSNYWRCPNCGSLLEKGVGTMFDQVIGMASCSGCGSEFRQSEVYDGKFDVSERNIDTTKKFRIIDSTAFWGKGHRITFTGYTPTELAWLLDGKLFPTGSRYTQAKCRELVNGNFRSALTVRADSNKILNLPEPGDADGYALAIDKFQLSYAVQNNISFQESANVFQATMYP
jgi:transcription elongation factor Elf1